MSSKTEHHANRHVRMIPMHPSIERELLKLHAEAEDGSEYVFPSIDGNTNLRTTLLKIIHRAGVVPWSKVFQNLRASAATDFARKLPSHVAAAICGHTEQIAMEHYRMATDWDLDEALKAFPEKSVALAVRDRCAENETAMQNTASKPAQASGRN